MALSKSSPLSTLVLIERFGKKTVLDPLFVLRNGVKSLALYLIDITHNVPEHLVTTMRTWSIPNPFAWLKTKWFEELLNKRSR